MARLTISVPDHIKEELDSYKLEDSRSYKELCISELCQEALEQKLNDLRTRKEQNKLPTIERLKQQKITVAANKIEDIKKKVVERGYAQANSTLFTYEDFLVLESGECPAWFDDWFNNNVKLEIEAELPANVSFDAKTWFLSGVAELWNSIKNDI